MTRAPSLRHVSSLSRKREDSRSDGIGRSLRLCTLVHWLLGTVQCRRKNGRTVPNQAAITNAADEHPGIAGCSVCGSLARTPDRCAGQQAARPKQCDERDSANFLSDQRVALPERLDNGKPFLFKHSNRSKPSGHRLPVGSRIGFHDSPSAPPYRRQCGTKCDLRHSGSAKGAINKKAGDSPARRGVESACESLVLPSVLDPRQVLASAELTPPNRSTLSINQNSVRMTPTEEGVMIPSVRFLTTLAMQRPSGAFSMIEHAPTTGLNAVVFSEEPFEVRPGRGGELTCFECDSL